MRLAKIIGAALALTLAAGAALAQGAIEKPKVAAEMPSSSVIGRMNRPRLWRSPMQMEMMSPLSAMRTSMARRLWMAVMDG